MRPRVLVIDDNEIIGGAVRRALFGYEVFFTTSEREALERVGGGEEFDVLICDVHMPELEGPELLSRLADVAPDLAQRSIFLTADHDMPRELAGRPVVSKPFETHLLRSVIAQYAVPAKLGTARARSSQHPTMPAPKAEGED